MLQRKFLSIVNDNGYVVRHYDFGWVFESSYDTRVKKLSREMKSILIVPLSCTNLNILLEKFMRVEYKIISKKIIQYLFTETFTILNILSALLFNLNKEKTLSCSNQLSYMHQLLNFYIKLISFDELNKRKFGCVISNYAIRCISKYYIKNIL